MKALQRFIRRFMFAWHYAYQTDKWKSFAKHYGVKEDMKEL